MSNEELKPPREAGRLVLDLDTADVVAARIAEARLGRSRRLRQRSTDGIYDQAAGPAGSESERAIQRQVLDDAENDRGR